MLGRRDARHWGILLALALALLSVTPWLHVTLNAVREAQTSVRTIDRYGLVEALRHLLSQFSNGNALLGLFLLGISITLPATKPLRFIQTWLLGGLGILLAVNAVVPILTEKRYLLQLFPALAVNVAVGIAALDRPYRIGVVTLWIGAAIFTTFDPTAQNGIHSLNWHPPLKQWVAAFEQATQPNDALLYHLPDETLESEVPQLMAYYTQGLMVGASLIPSGHAITEATYLDNTRRAVGDAPRVWLGYETARRNWRVGLVEDGLLPELGFARCNVHAADDLIYAALYTRPNTQPVTFGETVQLFPQGVRLQPNTLYVVVGVQQAAGYSVGLQLLNSAGELLRQADFGLSAAYTCHAATLDLTELPNGDYQLIAVVYNWQTGERLPYSGGVAYPLARFGLESSN
ncbi:MAG: hypothetical protein ACOYL5_17310 [Phototrophicaceae bacterium]